MSMGPILTRLARMHHKALMMSQADPRDVLIPRGLRHLFHLEVTALMRLPSDTPEEQRTFMGMKIQWVRGTCEDAISVRTKYGDVIRE